VTIPSGLAGIIPVYNGVSPQNTFGTQKYAGLEIHPSCHNKEPESVPAVSTRGLPSLALNPAPAEICLFSNAAKSSRIGAEFSKCRRDQQ